MQNKIPSIYKNLNIVLEDECSIPVQISDQIIWFIASGRLKVGDRLPPIRDLAKALGVNQNTVRAAYMRLVDLGIAETHQGSGSTIKKFDVSLLPIKEERILTNTIGLVIPGEYNPFYTEFIKGVEETATKHKIFPIVCRTQNKRVLGRLFISMLIAKKVDGVIVTPYGLEEGEENEIPPESQKSFQVPVVFVDRPQDEGVKVLIDAKRAGFLATDHLIGHGHKRIAILTGLTNVPTLNQCFEGYREALAAHGIVFEPSLALQVNRFDYKAGYDAAKQLLEWADFPRAIFAAGDVLAIGAIRAIKEKGLRVPEDIAITGYNDIDVAQYCEPPLTTAHVPVYEMGVQSMELLYQLIHEKKTTQSEILLPATLVVRRSCGCK